MIFITIKLISNTFLSVLYKDNIIIISYEYLPTKPARVNIHLKLLKLHIMASTCYLSSFVLLILVITYQTL